MKTKNNGRFHRFYRLGTELVKPGRATPKPINKGRELFFSSALFALDRLFPLYDRQG